MSINCIQRPEVKWDAHWKAIADDSSGAFICLTSSAMTDSHIRERQRQWKTGFIALMLILNALEILKCLLNNWS